MPGSLTHAHDAVGLGRLEGLLQCTDSVVLYRHIKPPLSLHNVDVDRLSLRMASHITKHFLKYPEHRHGHGLGQFELFIHRHAPLKLLFGRLDKILRLPLQSTPQALVVQNAGAQIRDDAAHYLTDTNGWYLTTDVPNGLKHFERTALTNSMDGDFDTGNVRYKARERYSFGWSDPLGMFGSPGSS